MYTTYLMAERQSQRKTELEWDESGLCYSHNITHNFWFPAS
jgi:hypothetical protein